MHEMPHGAAAFARIGIHCRCGLTVLMCLFKDSGSALQESRLV